MNDPYVQRSKAEGYRSRAAYKLIEIDDRYKSAEARHEGHRPRRCPRRLVPGRGGADQVHGGQAACRRHRLSGHGCRCPARRCWRWISSTPRRRQRLVEVLGGEPDVVLSDMAAPTTGHGGPTTSARASVRGGGGFRDVRAEARRAFPVQDLSGRRRKRRCSTMLKKNFRSVHHVKPPASRDESVELYLLAKDFKGRELPASSSQGEAGA